MRRPLSLSISRRPSVVIRRRLSVGLRRLAVVIRRRLSVGLRRPSFGRSTLSSRL